MPIAKKDFFWNKLKRARRKMERRTGRAPQIDEFAVETLGPDMAAGRPIDIAGFTSPMEALANARQIDMTGSGPNGVIEPGNPVAMLNTTGGPAMIHESEGMVTPEGGPPNARQVLSNAQLKEVEERYNVPGLFTGSKNYPPATKQAVLKQIERDYKTRGYQRGSRLEARFGSISGGQVVPRGKPDPDIGLSDIGAPGLPQIEPDLPGITATEKQPTAVPMAPPTFAPLETVQLGEPSELPTMPGVEPVPAEEPAPAWAQRFGVDVIPGEGAAGIYGAGAAEGFDFLRDVARGQSPALDIAENRAMEDLAARQSYDDIAFEQQVEGMDISPSQMGTLRAMHERDQRSKTGKMLSDIAEQRGKSAEQAARDLVSQGLAQSRWEADYTQRISEYGDRQGWMQYNELLKSGDFDAAAEKYRTITGNDIDLGDLREEYYNDKAAEASVELAGVVDRVWHTLLPDELGNPDWQRSPRMMNAVQRYWRWNNDGEDFDPNNPAHVIEMNDHILKSMSMSDVGESIAKLKTEPFYQALQTRAAAGDQDAVAELAKWDAALTGLTQLSYLDGYQIGMQDGKIVFKDANGDVVYSVDPPPGVTIPDYESLGGIRDLLGDGYDDILASAQADDPDEGNITAGLMSTYGFTADQADRAFETMRYAGYDDYVASAKAADVTPMSKDEWIAAERPEDYASAGVPTGSVKGDIWFDNGSFYVLGDDGREVLEYVEGEWFARENRDIMDAWTTYAAQNPTAEVPADVLVLADEMATMVLLRDHDLPESYKNMSHPVYQAILTNSRTKQGVGGKKLRDPQGTSADQWYSEILGRVPSPGTIANYNGRLLVVTGSKKIKQGGDDGTVYYFTDMITGVALAIRIDQNDFWNMQVPIPRNLVPTTAGEDLSTSQHGMVATYTRMYGDMWANATSTGDWNWLENLPT